MLVLGCGQPIGVGIGVRTRVSGTSIRLWSTYWSRYRGSNPRQWYQYQAVVNLLEQVSGFEPALVVLVLGCGQPIGVGIGVRTRVSGTSIRLWSTYWSRYRGSNPRQWYQYQAVVNLLEQVSGFEPALVVLVLGCGQPIGVGIGVRTRVSGTSIRLWSTYWSRYRGSNPRQWYQYQAVVNLLEQVSGFEPALVVLVLELQSTYWSRYRGSNPRQWYQYQSCSQPIGVGIGVRTRVSGTSIRVVVNLLEQVSGFEPALVVLVLELQSTYWSRYRGSNPRQWYQYQAVVNLLEQVSGFEPALVVLVLELQSTYWSRYRGQNPRQWYQYQSCSQPIGVGIGVRTRVSGTSIRVVVNLLEQVSGLEPALVVLVLELQSTYWSRYRGQNPRQWYQYQSCSQPIGVGIGVRTRVSGTSIRLWSTYWSRYRGSNTRQWYQYQSCSQPIGVGIGVRTHVSGTSIRLWSTYWSRYRGSNTRQWYQYQSCSQPIGVGIGVRTRVSGTSIRVVVNLLEQVSGFEPTLVVLVLGCGQPIGVGIGVRTRVSGTSIRLWSTYWSRYRGSNTRQWYQYQAVVNLLEQVSGF